MIVGIPKEIKDNEYRVSAPPSSVSQLIQHGHTVLVETGAGEGSRFTDEEYEAVGSKIVPAAADAWGAEMVIKVKEPQPSEFRYLRPDLLLFTYLHLAAEEKLTRAMLESGVTGIAYETVEGRKGGLPLLAPMSEVAGRMATQVGAHYLEKPNGGVGMLLGGVPGVRPANVVVLGGGVVGTNAAQMALGMGANVTILDVNLDRLRDLDLLLHGRFQTVASHSYNIAKHVATADLLIGAVLIKGAKAPTLVNRSMISSMSKGSVVVDVAVDQGGCIETTHATTHSNATYYVDEILHYGVANMPGAVPRTSTLALSNATLPYTLKLAGAGALPAINSDPGLALGVNTWGGKLTYEAVAEAFDLPYTPLSKLI